MLIIKHRWHDLDQKADATSVDGAEIDIRIHNGELVVEHDPFKDGPKLADWLVRFKGRFLIANVKEEGLAPHLTAMLACTSIEDYFILDETVPFIIKHCKAGNTNFGIRVSKWEPILGALNIMQQLNPSPSWIWLDTFDKQIPADRQELLDLIAAGAKICLVSPELHPEHCANEPTDAFMRSVNNVGIENFHAVCTKCPAFWSDHKEQLNIE